MLYEMKRMIQNLKEQIKDEVSRLETAPRLSIITTSPDFASKKYVNNKVKTGKELGIDVQVLDCSECTVADVIQKIHDIASQTNGIIVQLPLNDKLKGSEREILDSIPANMDVDGLSTASIGRLWANELSLKPCTPTGIMTTLHNRFPEGLTGKDVVIVNRSDLIGKPLSKMLLDEHCTVTVCHSKTKDLTRKLSRADIIVTAVGKPGFIKPENLKDNVFVVDAGIARNAEGKVCGDCDPMFANDWFFEATPVPGGMGVMTVLSLMQNTVKAYHLNN